MTPEGTSLLHIPLLSKVAALMRDFQPRWSSAKLLPDDGTHSVYRWENHQRLVCATFGQRKLAQAYCRQLNTEEFLTQALMALRDEESSDNSKISDFLTAHLMDLPVCPDTDMFQTCLYPHLNTEYCG